MAAIHTVTQGEHLSGIAHAYGFSDYRAIWNHPDNAALKQMRQNPNVLYPGDQVIIPDKNAREYGRPTDQKHSFILKTTPLTLQLKLGRIYDKPIASTPCELFLGLERVALTSDSQGKIVQEIAPTLAGARLVIKDQVTAKGRQVPFETELTLKIGYLDPVDEPSGQIARLSNLGYYRSSLDEADAAEFQSAVEEFQCENGLNPPDGICGPITQAKLKQVHGC